MLFRSRVLIAFGADPEVISSNTMEAKTHLASLGLVVYTGVDGSVEVFRPEIVVVEVPEDDGSKEVEVEKAQRLVAQWLPPTLVRVREAPGKEHYRITLKAWALPLQMEGS